MKLGRHKLLDCGNPLGVPRLFLWALLGALSTLNPRVLSASPAIHLVQPTTVKVGETFSVLGVGLSGATAAMLNDIPLTIIPWLDGSRLLLIAPNTAMIGLVTVVTPFGQATSDHVLTVTLPPPPEIIELRPDTIKLGKRFSIFGRNLKDTKSITLNGIELLFSFGGSPDYTELIATAPSNAMTGPVTVSTPGGQGTSTNSLTVLLPGPPKITAFVPPQDSPGNRVFVAGENLTYVTKAKIGTTDVAFSYEPWGPSHGSFVSELCLKIPREARTGPITIETPYGIAVTPQDFVVTNASAPNVPLHWLYLDGAVGLEFPINGYGLEMVTAVKINGVPAPFRFGPTPALFVTVPPNATSGPLSLEWPTGTNVLGNFTVFTVPFKIRDFIPISGPPGTTVQLFGTRLREMTHVWFNAVPATFTLPTNGQPAHAVVPEGAATGPILIATSTETNTSESAFTVRAEVDLRVSRGPLPPLLGQHDEFTYQVVVENRGPSPAANVELHNVFEPIVSYTSTPPECTWSNGFLSCSLGNLAAGQSKSITITLQPAAPGNLKIHFAVRTNEFDPNLSNNGQIVYLRVLPAADSLAPKIIEVAPATLAPGNVFQITGLNLSNLTSVRLNDLDLPFALLPGSKYIMTAVAPARRMAGKVTVTNPAGADTSAQMISVVPPNVPMLWITDFVPKSGPPGTPVRISGWALNTVTQLVFNGVRASFTYSNGIQTAVPEGAVTGPISIESTVDSHTTGPVFTVRPEANLALSTPLLPLLIAPGDPLSYIVVVTNRGPSAASDISVQTTLSGSASATLSDGQTTVLTSISPLAPGESETIALTVRASSMGSLRLSSVVGSADVDPVSSDNIVNSELRVGTGTLLAIRSPRKRVFEIFWSGAVTNLTLETTDAPDAIIWQEPTAVVEERPNLKLIVITNEIPGAFRFFRLRQK